MISFQRMWPARVEQDMRAPGDDCRSRTCITESHRSFSTPRKDVESSVFLEAMVSANNANHTTLPSQVRRVAGRSLQSPKYLRDIEESAVGNFDDEDRELEDNTVVYF